MKDKKSIIECAEQCLLNNDPLELVEMVIERYTSIAVELQLPSEVVKEIENDLAGRLAGDRSKPKQFVELVKASGEDNHAKLVAAYFQKQGVEAHYVNPKDAGLFVSADPGNAQVLQESYELLYSLRERSGILILCFYHLPELRKERSSIPFKFTNLLVSLGVGTIVTLLALSANNHRLFEFHQVRTS